MKFLFGEDARLAQGLQFFQPRKFFIERWLRLPGSSFCAFGGNFLAQNVEQDISAEQNKLNEQFADDNVPIISKYSVTCRYRYPVLS